LALKYGFIRVIFFPSNVMKAEKHSRKLPCHLLHVSARKLVNVVESVAQHVADGPKARVENANSEGNALHVHRENEPQGVSDQLRGARKPHAHHVHKGSVLLVKRGNGRLDPGELKALPRELQWCGKLRLLLRPERPQSRIFKRLRYLKLRLLLRPGHP